MNLVQTLPELQVACLGGLQGVGYAEIISIEGNSECRGVIVFDTDEDVTKIETEQTVFEGIVYNNGCESFESIPVEILMINQDQNQEPGATFVAKAGI